MAKPMQASHKRRVDTGVNPVACLSQRRINMTDSEKLDRLLKMVSEIREYIGNQPDCPQNLWGEGRIAVEQNRQRIALGLPYGYVRRSDGTYLNSLHKATWRSADDKG